MTDFPEWLQIKRQGKNARVAWKIRRRQKIRERRYWRKEVA